MTALVRASDPPTSHAAALAVAPHVGRLQALVLDLIGAEDEGLTDDELIQELGDECPGSVVKRRGELVNRGLVTDSGLVARTRRGRWAIVWTVV